MRISDWSSDVCSSDLLGPSDTASIGIVQLDRDPNPLPDVLNFTGQHESDTCCLTDDDDIGCWSEPTDGLRSEHEPARVAGQFSDQLACHATGKVGHL